MNIEDLEQNIKLQQLECQRISKALQVYRNKVSGLQSSFMKCHNKLKEMETELFERYSAVTKVKTTKKGGGIKTIEGLSEEEFMAALLKMPIEERQKIVKRMTANK